MNDLMKRLSKLERERLEEPLIVLATTPTGETVVTVDEMIQKGFGFCRVISGSSLADLDRILSYMCPTSVIS